MSHMYMYPTTAITIGDGGTPFADANCPLGAWVTQIAGQAGEKVDRLGMGCSDGTFLGAHGGSGGVAYSGVDAAGFMDVTGRYNGGILYNVAGLGVSGTKFNGGIGWGDSNIHATCPEGEVIVGYGGGSGSMMGQLKINCAPHPRDQCSKDISTEYCKQMVARGDNVAQLLVNSACGANMTQQCLDEIRAHPGQYDALMGDYCQKNPGAEICSCYAPFPADAPAELRVISAKPQCWSRGCNVTGYKNANIAADQSACGNIKVCSQNSNMSNMSNMNMDNVEIKQDCSDGTPKTIPPLAHGAPDKMAWINGSVRVGGHLIPIIYIIIAFIGMIMMAYAGSVPAASPYMYGYGAPSGYIAT